MHDVGASVVFSADILHHLWNFIANWPPGAMTFATWWGQSEIVASRNKGVVLQAAFSNSSVSILFGADCIDGVNVPLTACSNLAKNTKLSILISQLVALSQWEMLFFPFTWITQNWLPVLVGSKVCTSFKNSFPFRSLLISHVWSPFEVYSCWMWLQVKNKDES